MTSDNRIKIFPVNPPFQAAVNPANIPSARAAAAERTPNKTVFLTAYINSENISMPPSFTPSQCRADGGLSGLNEALYGSYRENQAPAVNTITKRTASIIPKTNHLLIISTLKILCFISHPWIQESVAYFKGYVDSKNKQRGKQDNSLYQRKIPECDRFEKQGAQTGI